MRFVNEQPRAILMEWLSLEKRQPPSANNSAAGAVLVAPSCIRGWDFDKNQPIRPWHYNDPRWRKLMKLQASSVPPAVINETLDLAPAPEDHDKCKGSGTCRYRERANTAMNAQSDYAPSAENDAPKGKASDEQEAITSSPLKGREAASDDLRQHMLASLPTFDGTDPGDIDIFLSRLQHYCAAFPREFEPSSAESEASPPGSRQGQYKRLLFILTATRGQAYRTLDHHFQAFLTGAKTYDEVTGAFYQAYEGTNQVKPPRCQLRTLSQTAPSEIDLNDYHDMFIEAEDALGHHGPPGRAFAEEILALIYRIGLPRSIFKEVIDRYEDGGISNLKDIADEVKAKQETAAEAAKWSQLADDTTIASNSTAAGGV